MSARHHFSLLPGKSPFYSITVFGFGIIFLSLILYILRNSPLRLYSRQLTSLSRGLITAAVPEPNEKTVDGIAVPQAVLGIAPGVSYQVRTFTVNAKNGSLSPDKIIVYEGDIVQINFSTVDDSYEFSIPSLGIRQKAQEGETRIIEFQAVSAGSFPFLCANCDDGETKGFLYVKPRVSTS